MTFSILCIPFAHSTSVENFETIAQFLRNLKFDVLIKKTNVSYTLLLEKSPTGIKLVDSESKEEIQEGKGTGIV